MGRSAPACYSRPSWAGSSTFTRRRRPRGCRPASRRPCSGSPWAWAAWWTRSPILAVIFALVWRPPDATPTLGNFLYLTVLLGLFFLVFTLVLNPYMSLLPEITTAGRDRITTAAWQSIFSLTGTALAFAASGQIAARWGFAAMGTVLAPVGMLALLPAALAVRERAIDDERVDFVPALRTVLGHSPFRIFLLGFALLWLGLSMVQLSLTSLMTVLMGLQGGAVGTVLGMSVLVTLLATPAVTVVAHRIGSRRTLLGAMAAAAALLPLIASIGLWPLPVSAAVQGYVLIAMAGPVLAALFTLPNTLLADITQDVARARGQRLEGMFFAFQGLILNGATSISSALLGITLGVLGYESGLRLAPLVATGCVLAGIAVFMRFPASAPGPPAPGSGQASGPR